MDNNNDVNIYETELTGLSNMVIDSVEMFRLKHEKDEYTKSNVNEFFDDLIRMVRFYKCGEKPLDYRVDETTAERRAGFEVEYKECGNKILEDIKNASFTQNFMGYDKNAVHKFLDELVKVVKFNCGYEKINILIDTNAIVSQNIIRSAKGYDEAEVDLFLNKMIREFEVLNEIKQKHR